MSVWALVLVMAWFRAAAMQEVERYETLAQCEAAAEVLVARHETTDKYGAKHNDYEGVCFGVLLDGAIGRGSETHQEEE